MVVRCRMIDFSYTSRRIWEVYSRMICNSAYFNIFHICKYPTEGPGQLSRYSDSLRAGRTGDRIPVRGGARFSASVQTGPGAHPASCTMGTGSFPGVKRPGRGADHPPPSKCRGHERVGLYLCSPSGPSWPVIGRTLRLPFFNAVWVDKEISAESYIMSDEAGYVINRLSAVINICARYCNVRRYAFCHAVYVRVCY